MADGKLGYVDISKENKVSKYPYKSRAGVLLHVIEKGTPIDVVGGKYAIQYNEDGIEDLLRAASNVVGSDEPQHVALKEALKAKKPFKLIKDGKTEAITLTKIIKTPDFGGGSAGSGGGSANTALEESAAAWFCAVRFSMKKALETEGGEGMPSDKQFDKVKDRVFTKSTLTDIKQHLEDQPDWIDSCAKTANALYEEFGEKNAYNWYRGEGIVKWMDEQFKVINDAHIEPETGIKRKPFANLNKWTPADIWACRCNIKKEHITQHRTFAGFNRWLKECMDAQQLYGISLKKTEGMGKEANLKAVNYTSDRPVATYDKILAKSYDSLDVWMYTNGVSLEVQFRDTSGGDPLTWQGEVIGQAAKHGKIGGGVYDMIIQQVYGKPLYTNLSGIKSEAKNGNLNGKVLKLSLKHQKIIDGSNNPKKTSKFKAPTIDADLVERNRLKTSNKGQWIFSKYLGLKVVDVLESGNNEQANEAAQLIHLYATSQSKDSAPFLKTS